MRYRALLSFGAAAALCVSAWACASSAPEDDDDITLPERHPNDASDEASDGAADSAALVATDAGDASVAIAQANAALCGAPDLVMCFSFENEVVDKSPNQLVPTVSGVTFAPGHLGQAAVLDASSAIRFAAAAPLEVRTATIEAWVSWSGTAMGLPDGVVFDDDDRMSLTILADGTVQCIPNAAAPTAKITQGVWTHVACVFDGAAAHVYVDGKQVDTGDAGFIGSSPASTAALGGNAPSGEPFVGKLDSVRVFSVARSPAEIAEAAAP